ncbi:hypothetical protein, partial [Helicobacter marmotae]
MLVLNDNKQRVFQIETSALGRHSSDLENFEGSQAHSLASPPKFSKNPQSPTANLRSLDSQTPFCPNSRESEKSPLFCHSEGRQSLTEESLLSARGSLRESLATPLLCHSEGARSATEESPLSTKDSLIESPERQPFCHSEPPLGGEESLNESLVAKRDSSVVSLPQNDKLGYPQGKPTHNKHLQRKLLCHSKHCAESLFDSPEILQVCHSEGYGESLHKATRQSQSYCHSERSEESLYESLVAHRDSSVATLPQNDNKSQTSP